MDQDVGRYIQSSPWPFEKPQNRPLTNATSSHVEEACSMDEEETVNLEQIIRSNFKIPKRTIAR